MDGVVVIDKPSGPTSFEVVQRVRALLKVKKAGHTGTLDPMATGVLPICVGEATKIAGFITEGDKAYDAVIRLGERTDTQDALGKVIAKAEVPPLTPEVLEAALARFRGSFLQTPPMYSAVKVGGKRLHELARAGEEVERAPRKVTVYQLALRDFSATELRVSVRCSKGFFVRTLADELGQVIGCGAHLTALRRTASGAFSLVQAVSLDALEALAARGPAGLDELARKLVAAEQALVELPAITVTAEDAERVRHGVPLECAVEGGRLRILGPGGRLLAVGEAKRGRLSYLRVLVR